MIDLPDEVGGVGTPPSRYRSNSGIVKDVFDVIDIYDLSYYEGHAFKYLVRLGHKGTAESNLGKCHHFLLESEKRASRYDKVQVNHVSVSQVMDAFGLTGDISDVARRILVSKISGDPAYWLRLARGCLEEHMKAIGIDVQRSS
jgi:hypothetical protein